MVASIPEKVDLRNQCPPVYDQGQLGGCTANAIAGALEFDRIKQKLSNFVPSRLFIYYNERVMEGTEWPYDIAQFAVQPPQSSYKDALKYKAVQYQSVTQNLADMQGCLATGYPFVFGFTVYESFESPAVAKSGNMPMPKSGESIVGGHAVLAVGYDNDKRVFIVRNSWGPAWGKAGYFYMPYAYLLDDNLSDDLWTIRLVT
jgi:C1A family cysteine protease